ncbi:MAG: hypothetical protein ABJQ14_12910 [Hyphomicrobiales bacterium]
MISLNNNWPNTDNATRYKLFAELVVELVHSSSWDSYKCHTLSTVTKLREAAISCQKTIGRTVPKAGLQPIIDEINDAIASDLILVGILKDKKLANLDLTLRYSDPVEKILGRVELLLDIAENDYQEFCEAKVKTICTDQGSKINLQTVSKLYISFLVNAGFSKSYILACANEVFRDRDIGRCTPTLLQRFFGHFNRDGLRKFTLLFSGRSSYMEFMADLFGRQTFAEQSDLPNFPIGDLPPLFGSGSKKKIAAFSGIPASDPFSAAKAGETILGVTKSFHYLHPSQAGGGTDRVIYVVDEKRSKATRVDIRNLFQPHQHLRSRASQPTSVEGLAKYVFQGHSRKGRQRQDRLLRSLNSVALASNSSDLESRLIAIWSAFEALLPEPSKEEGKSVRITHFVPLIIPCACYDYLWANFNECYENCTKQFGDAFEDCVSHHSGSESAKGLASIMLGEKPAKDAVLQQVRSSPLMLSRMGKLHNLINKPSKLIKYWKLHEDRVGWQIHRIYRERNDIVHKGAKSPFLEGLVENSYGYYRGVFLGLEAVDKRFKVGDPTRALELISELYREKRTTIQGISQSEKLSSEQKKEQILDAIFEDRLC